MNNDAQASKGRNMNNPVRSAELSKTACIFRAEQCRRLAEHPCAARVQEGSSSIPELRSAPLHLHGVIIVSPLRGLENYELGIGWRLTQ